MRGEQTALPGHDHGHRALAFARADHADLRAVRRSEMLQKQQKFISILIQ